MLFLQPTRPLSRVIRHCTLALVDSKAVSVILITSLGYLPSQTVNPSLHPHTALFNAQAQTESLKETASRLICPTTPTRFATCYFPATLTNAQAQTESLNLTTQVVPTNKDVAMRQFPFYTSTLRPVCTVTFTSQGQLNNFLLSHVISTPTPLHNYRWS